MNGWDIKAVGLGERKRIVWDLVFLILIFEDVDVERGLYSGRVYRLAVDC